MAYLTNSRPVDVAVSSGSEPRRPTSVRRARDLAGEVLNERLKRDDAGARRSWRNGARVDMVGYAIPPGSDGSWIKKGEGMMMV